MDKEIVTPKEKLNPGITFIFDMDGTLYQLDGENHGFNGSSLQKRVLENCVRFIMQLEDLEEPEAVKKFTSLKSQYGLGLSQAFAQAYKITREDYFNYVWDIDPKDILSDYETSAEVIKALSQKADLILLTSAPSVWQKQVLHFLGLGEVFAKVITGESFGEKDEVFASIARGNSTSKIYSVGDQLDTDILPAQDLGMTGFYVSHPRELINLLELI